MQWQHPIERIWSYTPRQAHAWMELGAARHKREQSEMLSYTALAAQGEGKAIKRAIDGLSGKNDQWLVTT